MSSIDQIGDIEIPENAVGDLTLVSKWGCDGSSGHSMYKQKMGESSGGDASIFMISLVLLKLEDASGRTLWENLSPSSKDTCRPIKFIFAKETPELVCREVDDIKDQIAALLPTVIRGSNVSHKLLMTMVDQKVINHLTGNKGLSSCYICHAKPTQMNSIVQTGQKLVDEEDNFQYGISSLHAKINTFECLLHIGYKLKVRQWRSSKEIEEQIKERKKLIQKKFAEQLNINVDMPIAGFGNTNDGNTARKFC